MSDHIPIEIQTEITKRFPVKSLMRFRSVSKPWKSLIDSSQFVSDYNLRQNQHHLFIVYKDPNEYGLKYVSIVDDDKFPQQICDLSAIVPLFVVDKHDPKVRVGPTLVSTSQGLLCLYGCSRAYILNPFIRKYIGVTLPNVDYRTNGSFLGFGVCLKTCVPKVIQVTFNRNSSVTWKLAVFSLRSLLWRSRSFSKISDLPCESIKLQSSDECECVDGFIYWRAYCKDDDQRRIIISFDLANEEFGVINLPNDFQRGSVWDLCKYRESLVLIYRDYKISEGYDVWMMEDGVTKSFKKVFTINSTADCVTTMAISYNGEAVMEILEDYKYNNVASIESYEPSSNCFKLTKINGIHGSTSMSSYKETLLLHDY
ncbi:putative F-box protein At1g47730 [Rutidosis leptorrhynchoides]|uniref:putative F-box protein At1g47730 n=1 Tax=Rutidosis leptorrhynchoides TaxID=125765 RepID=UPI003A99EC25